MSNLTFVFIIVTNAWCRLGAPKIMTVTQFDCILQMDIWNRPLWVDVLESKSILNLPFPPAFAPTHLLAFELRVLCLLDRCSAT
jgi:hypothetical protein